MWVHNEIYVKWDRMSPSASTVIVQLINHVYGCPSEPCMPHYMNNNRMYPAWECCRQIMRNLLFVTCWENITKHTRSLHESRSWQNSRSLARSLASTFSFSRSRRSSTWSRFGKLPIIITGTELPDGHSPRFNQPSTQESEDARTGPPLITSLCSRQWSYDYSQVLLKRHQRQWQHLEW